ncbi:MAG: 23S rRNA (uracil(1939)-C(5))-methyltransferase RlmD [Legionellaceae bacterium]|nr:23S rRNA (uracil(1939)-C(5))-methyltransferase RlmD [Legionellaceae bacterium]
MKRRRKKIQLPPVTTFVEGFSHDGRGIARIDGKTTFIQGALANETVTFEYTRQKKDFDEGRLLTVETPSPERIDPECPHYDMCGGCSLQHLNSESQIEQKQALLLDALQRVGNCTPDNVLAPLTSDVWHYRNKARLSTRYVAKKEATLVGFRERNNPRYITDIHTCKVLNKIVADEIDNLRCMLTSFDNPSNIAQIEVAASENDVALIFRNMEDLTSKEEELLQAFSDKTNFKIFLQPGGPDSVFLFYPTNVSEFLTYSLDGFAIEYKFHPTDFTQVNAKINKLMVPMALEFLDLTESDVALDLFCGLGNFSLPLATKCKSVVAVEGSSAMVERAMMNAKDNGIDNITFLAANLEEEDSLNNPAFVNVNKLLLDPPRTGALEIVKQINKLNISKIVYVSCNPITLARDADILVNQHGYRLVDAGVMDMFPNTAHVESIAVFVQG